MTERTNDLTLAYARAQRDLRCVYSVGFYLKSDVEDRPRNVSVRVTRPGMSAIHPSRYIFRSESAKQESLLRAAWVSPETFQTGVVRAHLFPLRPASKRAWQAMLAVSFPVPLGDGSGPEVRREFGAVLYSGPRVIHSFDRSIELQPDDPGASSRLYVTFLEQTELKPGHYTLTTVLADPEGAEPHASRAVIEVPPIPKGELVLVGPILGRTAGPDLVVMGGEEDAVGSEKSFRPLLVQQLDEPVDLISLTQACLVGKKKRGQTMSVGRSLSRAEGDALGALEPVELSLEPEGGVECSNLVDLLPTASLPGGEYVFEAQLRSGDEGDDVRQTVRFAIGR